MSSAGFLSSTAQATPEPPAIFLPYFTPDFGTINQPSLKQSPTSDQPTPCCASSHVVAAGIRVQRFTERGGKVVVMRRSRRVGRVTSAWDKATRPTPPMADSPHDNTILKPGQPEPQTA